MKSLFRQLVSRSAPEARPEPWQVFRECERSLHLIQDLEPLARNLLGKIGEILHTDRLALALLDADRAQFRAGHAIGYDEAALARICFRAGDPLVKWFRVNETFLDLAAAPGIASALGDDERAILHSLDCRHLFPVMAMNRLIGIILCGGAAGRTFSQGELSLVAELGPQIGLALENAYLYQEQRDRFRRMSRADRLATVGELAAGAAHEIRNPLTAIKSSLQYLAAKPHDEVDGKLLASALSETSRIEKILTGLLSFARQSEQVMELVDLTVVLDQSVELIGLQAQQRGVEVTRLVGEPRLPVRGDREQLRQLFLNLFLNSLQAMESGGELKVEARTADAHTAIVVISDTGCGIPEESLDRIFDPFFTLKKGGTGLGLSICYGILKRHQGEIEVRSSVGTGTTIIIRLLLIDADPGASNV